MFESMQKSAMGQKTGKEGDNLLGRDCDKHVTVAEPWSVIDHRHPPPSVGIEN